jgi:membrane-bound metal-dependent hydrolase YbcI (DUF457 family)
MFIGHFAVSFAAKRVAPAASLGTLFVAAQLADLLWPTFVLLGLESFAISPGITAVTPLDFVSYPYSHSLLALSVWGILAGVLYWAFRRDVMGGATIAVVVLSHWVLDVITHRPDMPLAFGDTRVGLGLWHSTAGTLSVEGVMFLAAVASYALFTRPRDRTGSVGLWALIAFLVLIYGGNVFGPPPPSVPAVAWSAQALWLLVLWAFWVDRRRLPKRTVEGVAHRHTVTSEVEPGE